MTDSSRESDSVSAEGLATDSEAAEVQASFQDALKRHGHGFQYAVLKTVGKLHAKGSRWVPNVAELPVPLGAGPGSISYLKITYFTPRPRLSANASA